MAYLAQFEDLHAPIRRERVFWDRRDLFMESDEWLLSCFRLPKHPFGIMPQFGASVKEGKRLNAIPVPVQVPSTLGFLATGTFQQEMGDGSGMSQPTISKLMSAVLVVIKSLSCQYIQFPNNDALQNSPCD